MKKKKKMKGRRSKGGGGGQEGHRVWTDAGNSTQNNKLDRLRQEALSGDRETMFHVEITCGRSQRGRNQVTLLFILYVNRNNLNRKIKYFHL